MLRCGSSTRHCRHGNQARQPGSATRRYLLGQSSNGPLQSHWLHGVRTIEALAALILVREISRLAALLLEHHDEHRPPVFNLTRHPAILGTFIEVDASLELPIHAAHNIPVEEILWT